MPDTVSDAAAKLKAARAERGAIPEGQPSVDKKEINIGQGKNTNGEADAKHQADYSEATHELGGVTKEFRSAGAPPSEKPVGHVVQQGGGGAVRPSGEAI